MFGWICRCLVCLSCCAVNIVKRNSSSNCNGKVSWMQWAVVTFHERRSRGEMYIGHGRLCVCLSLAAFQHYCMDPDVSWGNGRGCPLVVHYWADLQLVHRFCCYNEIAPNVKCHRMLVLTVCLVVCCSRRWAHWVTLIGVATWVDFGVTLFARLVSWLLVVRRLPPRRRLFTCSWPKDLPRTVTVSSISSVCMFN